VLARRQEQEKGRRQTQRPARLRARAQERAQERASLPVLLLLPAPPLHRRHQS
jgi:hypothetical protein